VRHWRLGLCRGYAFDVTLSSGRTVEGRPHGTPQAPSGYRLAIACMVPASSMELRGLEPLTSAMRRLDRGQRNPPPFWLYRAENRLIHAPRAGSETTAHCFALPAILGGFATGFATKRRGRLGSPSNRPVASNDHALAALPSLLLADPAGYRPRLGPKSRSGVGGSTIFSARSTACLKSSNCRPVREAVSVMSGSGSCPY
jgi:hypothetical protein